MYICCFLGFKAVIRYLYQHPAHQLRVCTRQLHQLLLKQNNEKYFTKKMTRQNMCNFPTCCIIHPDYNSEFSNDFWNTLKDIPVSFKTSKYHGGKKLQVSFVKGSLQASKVDLNSTNLQQIHQIFGFSLAQGGYWC